MLGAVRGTNPETGASWDDTKRYLDAAGLPAETRHLIDEANVRRQVGKAASNLIHWAQITAILESFRLAEAYGVDPAALMEGGTDSRTLRELEQMRFTWYAKDIDTAQEMAAEVGVELPVAVLSRRLMPAITPDTIRALFP